MELAFVTTADGSHTLYVPELNEHYHSTNGALQESLHVFIEAGFRYVCKSMLRRPLHLLEVGFGTGLNALLTLLEAEKKHVEIYYETVEKYPLPPETIEQLNYGRLLPENSAPLFYAIHRAAWGKETPLESWGTLCKKQVDLRDYQPGKTFDLIYFDAFAPTAQPTLWTQEIFRKLHAALSDGGVLVTYSSKGSVKQALRAAGFCVERLPGAAGKRHMLRAAK